MSTSDPSAQKSHDRAIAAYRKGDLTQAFAEITATLKAAPKEAIYQADAGVILMAMGRMEEALVPLERAISLDPAHADAHYNLGQCFEQLGRREQAMTAFRAAVALNPKLGWRKVKSALGHWFGFSRT